MNESDVFKEYLEFVNKIISTYSKSVNLINDHEEITPADLNYALAQYLPTNIALIAEYQRIKIEAIKLNHEYQKWYDEKFIASRKELTKEVNNKALKVSVEEIKTNFRVQYSEEYQNWQDRISVADSQVAFFKRMLDQYDKFDRVLTTISQNMRTELYSLSVEGRMNADPTKNKVRRTLV